MKRLFPLVDKPPRKKEFIDFLQKIRNYLFRGLTSEIYSDVKFGALSLYRETFFKMLLHTQQASTQH